MTFHLMCVHIVLGWVGICQLMVKRCALCTGYLPRGGLPWNSVDRITDRPGVTWLFTVKHQLKQTKKHKLRIYFMQYARSLASKYKTTCLFLTIHWVQLY